MLSLSQRGNNVVFTIKVQPGAGRTVVAGYWEQALKVKVSKKPEGGEANKECIKLLAKTFNVPKQAIQIIKGEFAQLKVIEIENSTVLQINELLNQL